ncbi:MAG TPA: hypothetical protein VFA74_09530 [Terriglobales bacterium]|nr:hypothetical protein [Terriglobales bacterium]
MNCDALLYSYFEDDPSQVDVNNLSHSSEVAAHILVCADCSRFVEAQRELGGRLRLIRDSVPQVSLSLDSAVLANYRQSVKRPTDAMRPTSVPKRTGRLAIAVWRGAIAAVLAVALLFVAKKIPSRPSEIQAKQPATVRQATSADNVTPAVVEERNQIRRKFPASHPTGHKKAGAEEMMTNSLPAGFQGLMYCDQLSCDGPMDVIRMRLPISVADDGSTPASGTNNSTVVADVLIGADGIARGIRVVE